MLDVCYIDAMGQDTTKRVSFGDAVRHYRTMLGLKQGEVARRLGVSQNTVSRWEVAARPPAEYHLVRLAELLRADPEELRQGIIHTGGEDDDELRADIERIAVQVGTTPEHVHKIADAIAGLLTLPPEGAGHLEQTVRALQAYYAARGEDEDDDEEELQVKEC